MGEGVDASGVRLIGGAADWVDGAYADGAEDVVGRVLAEAGDRSTASDELAGHIEDWPTLYHLSRQRANLLRPLRFGPGVRVLDVGAGTGALARYVAETGADVVALEGTLARARATAARCDGLDNVEVLCGTVADYDDPAGFDVVLCVGVLEYAGAGGADFLAKLRALTRPDGALVVAIENQLGLKYLLGYGEDHLGEPWAGVEGYRVATSAHFSPDGQPAPLPPEVGDDAPPASPPAGGPRTYSRRGLGGLLAQAGFPAQRWLFPFPDYKLPAVVVDESAYAEVDAPDFIDQIVRWPCSPLASEPARLCDDRFAHRVFVEAGLGPDVANSFLVVAGHDFAATGRRVEPDVAAWFFGSERQRIWLGSKTFPSRDHAGEVTSASLAPSDRLAERGWLAQHRDARLPRVLGRTIEQSALEACEAGVDALTPVLRSWRDHLRTLEVEVAGEAAPSHPFAGPATRRLLPDDHLDVGLGNFIADVGGRLSYVDREWRAAGGVDADLVCLRALWTFACDLVSRGVRHPWPSSATVDEVTETLGRLCRVPAGGAEIERLRQAESELQAKVGGLSLATVRTELDRMGAMSQVAPARNRYLPFTALRFSLARSHAHLADVSRRLEVSLQYQAVLQQAIEAQRVQYEQLGRDGAELRQALVAQQVAAADAHARLQALEAEREAFERRLPVRVYRRLRRMGR